MPKVSIVIPAYNTMTFLPETLETVWTQTFPEFEVLIINDGSTDNLEHWVEQQTDPRLRMISQPNQGLAMARNAGIKAAQGEYIALLDADDLWEPTKLEQQVACLDHNPNVGLVYTWTALVDHTGQPSGHIIASQVEGEVWQPFLTQNWITCGSNPLIRRTCFDQVGFFDPQTRGAEDWDMWLRLAQQFQFAVIKAPLVKYRQSINSMSKDCDLMWAAARAVIEKQFQDQPTDLLYLRNHCYSAQALYLGWRALDAGDTQKSWHFLGQACAHRLQVTVSLKWLRLFIGILLLQCLGDRYFVGLRQGQSVVRHWARSKVSTISQFWPRNT